MADAEVARLVRALRTAPVPDGTVRRIVERAEGNAFYAEELLAASDLEAGGVPSGLADVLLIRFEQLSDTAQQVLRTAAVAGRRVEYDLLRDAVRLPEDELESALREAVERQLLVPGHGDTYSFRHALAREAVYADLLPGERSRQHGAFARLLASRGHPAESAAERAHHYRESHDLAEALAASPEAADHAQRVGAPAEELRHLETVLDLWSSVDPAARPSGEGSTAWPSPCARPPRRPMPGTRTARSPSPGPRSPGSARTRTPSWPPASATRWPGTSWASTASRPRSRTAARRSR